jgi:hypothetical protein
MMVEIESLLNSMQLMFQSRHVPPTVDEISDYFEVVFFPWFKTFAVMNKLVVLRRDELMVDISIAWHVV